MLISNPNEISEWVTHGITYYFLLKHFFRKIGLSGPLLAVSIIEGVGGSLPKTGKVVKTIIGTNFELDVSYVYDIVLVKSQVSSVEKGRGIIKQQNNEREKINLNRDIIEHIMTLITFL